MPVAPAAPNGKAAYRALQLTLYFMLAVVVLLTAAAAPLIASQVQTGARLSCAGEVILLSHTMRVRADALPLTEASVLNEAAGLRVLEASRRYSHTRPGEHPRRLTRSAR